MEGCEDLGEKRPNQPGEQKYQSKHLFSLVMGKFLRFEGPHLQPLSPSVSETLPAR